MLPSEITTGKIREVSDMCEDEDVQDAIDDAMEVHIDAVIDMLCELYELSDDQLAELRDRICIRLELLPPGSQVLHES